jgi:GNAT superfamily N-acetyltransferase
MPPAWPRRPAGTLSRFVDLDAARTEYRPTDRLYHYLAYLAVLPALRGQGLGTQLLEHHHRDLDAAGIAAYLEATGPRDSSLFTRHGYDPADPFPAVPEHHIYIRCGAVRAHRAAPSCSNGGDPSVGLMPDRPRGPVRKSQS